LKWTFKLYDLNGDGCISRGELTEVVQAVHELMGRRIENDDRKTREQVRAVLKIVLYIFSRCKNFSESFFQNLESFFRAF
jgi:Ca2+-binding EF-hand superfamily protein